MFQQTLDVVLETVQTVMIHDACFYDLRFHRLDAPEQVAQIRVNPQAFYPDPKPGDTVRINWVMGNVMGAEKLAEAAST